MLHSVKALEGATIRAIDGQIGHVKDIYFDDEVWRASYLVINTGFWLTGRLVFISPISLRKPDWPGKTFPGAITKEQVRDSPSIHTDKSVSRQNEEQYHDYFGYPFYWGGTPMWGDGLFPYAMEPYYADDEANRAGQLRQMKAYSNIEQIRRNSDDPHLRSCKTVNGYKLMASDGEIGNVTDILLDETTWAIRYFVIETSHWWSGQKVLIAPEWIIKVHWSDKTVAVNLSQDSVRNSPSYDPKQKWSRKSDIGLYEHDNREGYWPK